MTRDLESTASPLANVASSGDANPASIADSKSTSDANVETLSRRSFIAKTAATAAVFTIAPRHVLGRGYTPPSDLLNIAGVGVGGMGHTNLINCSDQNIVALCDVDWGYANKSLDRLDAEIDNWQKRLVNPPVLTP